MCESAIWKEYQGKMNLSGKNLSWRVISFCYCYYFYFFYSCSEDDHSDIIEILHNDMAVLTIEAKHFVAFSKGVEQV